jgi:hypothetical protein
MSTLSYRIEHRALVIAVSCTISVSHVLVAWMTQAIPSARSTVADLSNRVLDFRIDNVHCKSLQPSLLSIYAVQPLPICAWK